MTVQIEIPGGTADLYTEDEITPRRLKPVVRLSLQNGSVIQKMQDAGGEAGVLPADMTDAEADRFTDIQTITAWAYLAGWSLDRPLPATADDMFDVPQSIVTAIAQAATKAKQDAAKTLEPGAVTDPESPTSA